MRLLSKPVFASNCSCIINSSLSKDYSIVYLYFNLAYIFVSLSVCIELFSLETLLAGSCKKNSKSNIKGFVDLFNFVDPVINFSVDLQA